jgi:hypothetical protein
VSSCSVSEGKELRRNNFTRGVFLQAKSSESEAASWEPVMGTAVELHESYELCGAQTALAMSGSAALSERVETSLAQEAANVSPLREKASTSQSFSQRWWSLKPAKVERPWRSMLRRTRLGRWLDAGAHALTPLAIVVTGCSSDSTRISFLSWCDILTFAVRE